MVRTLGFQFQGPGSIPGQGTEIPQATQHSQKQTDREIDGTISKGIINA